MLQWLIEVVVNEDASPVYDYVALVISNDTFFAKDAFYEDFVWL